MNTKATIGLFALISLSGCGTGYLPTRSTVESTAKGFTIGQTGMPQVMQSLDAITLHTMPAVQTAVPGLDPSIKDQSLVYPCSDGKVQVNFEIVCLDTQSSNATVNMSNCFDNNGLPFLTCTQAPPLPCDPRYISTDVYNGYQEL